MTNATSAYLKGLNSFFKKNGGTQSWVNKAFGSLMDCTYAERWPCHADNNVSKEVDREHSIQKGRNTQLIQL